MLVRPPIPETLGVIAHCRSAFYRQSLQIQHLHAELFHKATALRGINGPDDVQKMPLVQRQLALKSILVARRGLDITVNSPAYREGMKYGINLMFLKQHLLTLSQLFITLMQPPRSLLPFYCDWLDFCGLSVQWILAQALIISQP
jgi:hypothetical protein